MTVLIGGVMTGGNKAGTTVGGAGAAIGDPVTGGTTGAVLLVGSGPVLAQDATNFFWDSTSHRLGLGNAAPAQRLHVTGTGRFSAGIILDALTAGRVLIAGASGAIADDAELLYNATTNTLTAGVLQATGLTSGRVPFAGASGVLGDSAALAFAAGTLSTTALQATGLTAGRVPIVSTAGLLADDAELLYDATTNVLTAGSLQATGLTSGRVPFAGASGLLGDASTLTFSAGTLTASAYVSSGSALPLQTTITDGAAAAQLEGARFRHQSSVTATAGTGVYASFWTSNGVAGGGTLREAARIVGLLHTVTDANEAGTILFQTIQAGTVANSGHWRGTSFFSAGAIGIGTVTGTGSSTTQWQVSNTGAMWTYNSNLGTVGGHTLTGAVNTSGRRSFFISTPSANTGITTTTEKIGHAFGTTHTSGVPDLTSIVQTWANGTVALQRENVWVAPTYLQTSGTQVMTMTCHHDFGSIPTITGTTNSQTGARVARFGGSAAQGVTAAATTYVGIELVPSTITYTGGTQVTSPVAASQMRLDVLTLTDGTAVTMDRAATLDIVGPVAGTGAGPVTITDALSVYVRTGTSKFNDRVVMGTPNSAIADAKLDASQASFYLNEAGNLLVVKVKYADGTTVKTGTIALV